MRPTCNEWTVPFVAFSHMLVHITGYQALDFNDGFQTDRQTSAKTLAHTCSRECRLASLHRRDRKSLLTWSTPKYDAPVSVTAEERNFQH